MVIVDDNLSLDEIHRGLSDGSIKINDFKTSSNPDDTISKISSSIISDKLVVTKIGISMFGPLEISKKSDNYGMVLNTPKPGWKHFNVVR